MNKCLVTSNDFPAIRNYTMLSAANVSPTFKGAEEAICKWQKDLLENGPVNFNDDAEENVFKPLKIEVSKLLNCDIDEVACGSSATELINSVAWGIYPKSYENVVSCEASFPSTVYPWTRLSLHSKCEIRLAKYDDNFYTNINDILELIDNNTSVVTVSHIEFTNGQIHDLKKISKVAHENNALVVVDATQSTGCYPIDVKECDVDILISASYKWLCCSFGSAIMYIKKKLCKEICPGLFGFRSHKDMWDCKANRLELKENADRFEFATMHFGSIYGLTESLKLINNIGICNIFEYNLSLTKYLISQLQNLENIKIISPIWKKNECSSIITFFVTNVPTEHIIYKFLEKKIVVTNRNNFIRVSIHFYNNIHNIDHLINSLKFIIDQYTFIHHIKNYQNSKL